jgi:unsaturated rhamnogalacturonyl hydrolase
MSARRLLQTPLAQLANRKYESCLHTSRLLAAVMACCSVTFAVHAQTKPFAERIAKALVEQEPAPAWTADSGTELLGLDAEWYNTADGDYFRYVKRTVDAYLEANGTDKLADKPEAAATLARQLLLLHRVTLAPKYYEAANTLRKHLAAACGLTLDEKPANGTEISSDDACMAAPFLAEYASVFHQPQDFAAIAKSLARWNDGINRQDSAQNGALSKARFAALLVDTIPYYPVDDPARAQLTAMLSHAAATIATPQGKAPQGEAAPAALSPVSTSLYVYALLKGVRLGILPQQDSAVADRVWRASFPNSDAISIANIKGAGELLLAATEVDLAPTATLGRGNTVMLDAWFNSQQRKNAAGQVESFHYKWSDLSDSGYSLLGHLFESYGAATAALDSAPTKQKLGKAQYYLIVSPDIPVKNPNPHYMTDADAGEIAAWVHDGGILILMENDAPNADVSHLNLLADRVGLHFDDVLHHHILGEHIEDGRIPVTAGGALFHHDHTLYMKDTCAITIHGAGTVLLRDRGDIVMAAVKYGRGMVFAAVDPWLYNEYTDGRKNPQIYNQFDNFEGGKEVVRWLMEQRPNTKGETRKKQARKK